MSNFFRGTAAGQDFRFQDKHAQLVKHIAAKATPEFAVKIAMSKVRRVFVDAWVHKRITELLHGVEDEIAINMVVNHLSTECPDPKELAAVISGVLEAEAVPFVAELWRLLASAQSHPTGIPVDTVKREAAQRAAAAIVVPFPLQGAAAHSHPALRLGAGTTSDPTRARPSQGSREGREAGDDATAAHAAPAAAAGHVQHAGPSGGGLDGRRGGYDREYRREEYGRGREEDAGSRVHRGGSRERLPYRREHSGNVEGEGVRSDFHAPRPASPRLATRRADADRRCADRGDSPRRRAVVDRSAESPRRRDRSAESPRRRDRSPVRSRHRSRSRSVSRERSRRGRGGDERGRGRRQEEEEEQEEGSRRYSGGGGARRLSPDRRLAEGAPPPVDAFGRDITRRGGARGRGDASQGRAATRDGRREQRHEGQRSRSPSQDGDYDSTPARAPESSDTRLEELRVKAAAAARAALDGRGAAAAVGAGGK